MHLSGAIFTSDLPQTEFLTNRCENDFPEESWNLKCVTAQPLQYLRP
jgi:hypothetical protein